MYCNENGNIRTDKIYKTWLKPDLTSESVIFLISESARKDSSK